MKYRYFDLLPRLTDSYTGSQGHLSYKPWHGGFNNARMSYELATCLAYMLDRTLVLPAEYKITFLDQHAGLDFFFDMSDVKVKTLPFHEYTKLRNVNPSYNSLALSADVYDRSDLGHSFYKFPENVAVPSWFARHRAPIDLGRFKGDLIFFDGQLIGNFYQAIYTPQMAQLKLMIAKHVRYRPEIFDIAERCAQRTLGRFYSMHVRRGDFQVQYRHVVPTIESLLSHANALFTEQLPLYISTDESDKSFFDPLRQERHVFFYDDVAEPNVPTSWIPMVEQLICAQGAKFVGAPLSTFSSYIFRLRGYMGAEDMKYYTTLSGEPPQIDFAEDPHYDSSWVREYRDAFDFERPY